MTILKPRDILRSNPQFPPHVNSPSVEHGSESTLHCAHSADRTAEFHVHRVIGQATELESRSLDPKSCGPIISETFTHTLIQPPGLALIHEMLDFLAERFPTRREEDDSIPDSLKRQNDGAGYIQAEAHAIWVN
jgi:hypothetical protein